jgi:hypothetical protein
MTITEIANRIVTLNRENDHESVYQELYHPDAVSIENWSGTPEQYVGLDAIRQKAEGWVMSVAEIHEVRVGEPIVSDASIAMTFFMDVTYKDPAMGRQSMTELAIYTVKDGKIVAEEFRA